MLALPGHDGGGLRGAAAIADPDPASSYMGGFGARLAEAGYIVLAIDVAGIGELAYLDYRRLVNEGLLIGDPLKRLMLEQVHEATDFLLSRPEVDPARAGVVGLSLGGELATFAAALDPRLRFAVASGFLSYYRNYPPDSMPSLYIPGILTVADVPDLASLVAPRPMLVQAGRQDQIAPFEGARVAFDQVRRAYAGAGAPSAVAFSAHAGGHVMPMDEVLAWLGGVAGARPGYKRP